MTLSKSGRHIFLRSVAMAEEQWTKKWRQVRELGKGGQGTTYEVRSLADDKQIGVLKLLRDDSDLQARRRMAREAINLDGLSNERIKVPKLLDHNTQHYSNMSIQMYLVMEYISGDTLDTAVMKRGGRLSLEQSVALASDICVTIAAMHKQDILHRDLKPANLIVRDFETSDLIVVDLGLSFDRTREQETVTQTGETMKNELLALPEAITATGDRRDKRSDITNIVAVFYYCLSGCLAGHLRDQHNLAPHHRSGQKLENLLPGDGRGQQVEYLLDLGFTYDIEGRFQSIDDLQTRLGNVLRPVGVVNRDPVLTDMRLGAKLRLTDRKLQLHEYLPVAHNLQNAIQGHVSTLAQQVKTFTLSLAGIGVNLTPPTGVDTVLEIGAAIMIGIRTRPDSRIINLHIGAKGDRCVLLQTVRTNQGGAVGPATHWNEVAWFDPSNPLNQDLVIKWTNDLVSTVMEEFAN